jgi:hypothetical protein
VSTTRSGLVNIDGIIEAREDALPCVLLSGPRDDCSETIYYFDLQDEIGHWDDVMMYG